MDSFYLGLILGVTLCFYSTAQMIERDQEISSLKNIFEKIGHILVKLEEQEEKLTRLEESQKTIRENMEESQRTIRENMEEANDDCHSQNSDTRNALATLQHLLNTDECTDLSHNCTTDAECTDTVVSFRCNCKPGFSGDGHTCTYIDECEGEHQCDPHATCMNFPGNYSCACQYGFRGDGNTCEDVQFHGCNEPYKLIQGVGCLHLIEESHKWDNGREVCKELKGDLFVAENTTHYLRLAQYFINTPKRDGTRYVFVGVKEGVWLNGRKVLAEEVAPRSPSMTFGTCSCTDGDFGQKFLLWATSCKTKLWPLCEQKL